MPMDNKTFIVLLHFSAEQLDYHKHDKIPSVVDDKVQSLDSLDYQYQSTSKLFANIIYLNNK